MKRLILTFAIVPILVVSANSEAIKSLPAFVLNTTVVGTAYYTPNVKDLTLRDILSNSPKTSTRLDGSVVSGQVDGFDISGNTVSFIFGSTLNGKKVLEFTFSFVYDQKDEALLLTKVSATNPNTGDVEVIEESDNPLQEVQSDAESYIQNDVGQFISLYCKIFDVPQSQIQQ